jgi:hypothetical protein
MYYFCGATLGFGLSLVLARQAQYHLNNAPSLYAFIILGIEFHIYAWELIFMFPI